MTGRSNPFTPGDTIHGHAGGAFGRDSYACRFVLVVGTAQIPWIVTQQFGTQYPEFTTFVQLAWDERDNHTHCTCGEVENQP